tara:strand:- start:449 stop:1222 length:774 start_codon:yes stop_codon:yes gene_type:complete
MEYGKIYKINDRGMFITKNKDKLKKKPLNNDNIYLVLQFFIHSNEERQNEIKTCLKNNIKLGLFTKIIMFNEKIYTSQELGLSDEEMKIIEQVNIEERLKFSTCFDKIKSMKLDGYIVVVNSDIFFDKTITNVRKSCLSEVKSLYTLLRFEYLEEKKLGFCKLFKYQGTNTPRSDSQDVWIYHTNHTPSQEIITQTNFNFGKPGCDNKITYIFTQNKYICLNVPWNVKTYHYHKTEIRNYSVRDVLLSPYLHVEPIL